MGQKKKKKILAQNKYENFLIIYVFFLSYEGLFGFKIDNIVEERFLLQIIFNYFKK